MENHVDLPINAIHMHGGCKADLYPVKDGDELRTVAFGRRQRVDLGNSLDEVYLYSPEDLIIYKLCYYRINQQTKHLRYITSIVITLEDELDFGYVDKWVKEKGVLIIWRELIERIYPNK